MGIDTELEAVGRPADGQGLFSVGPSYHFLGMLRNSRFDPFVVGGFTRPFYGYPGSLNLGNFGGGINYWFFKRVALRVDCRDYVSHSGTSRFATTYPAVRIGMTFR